MEGEAEKRSAHQIVDPIFNAASYPSSASDTNPSDPLYTYDTDDYFESCGSAKFSSNYA